MVRLIYEFFKEISFSIFMCLHILFKLRIKNFKILGVYFSNIFVIVWYCYVKKANVITFFYTFNSVLKIIKYNLQIISIKIISYFRNLSTKCIMPEKGDILYKKNCPLQGKRVMEKIINVVENILMFLC